VALQVLHSNLSPFPTSGDERQFMVTWCAVKMKLHR